MTKNSSDMPSSDEQLFRQYRDESDIDSFERLVHRYEDAIYGYLARYLRSNELAEEVFQATFFRVHEKASLFTDDRRFKPWLYSIATNQAIDVLRKEGRHKAVSLFEESTSASGDVSRLVQMLEAETPTPPELVAENERRAWTRQAIDNLPEHLRLVVLLIYFQGLKYREAAEALDIPVGTVKSRSHKALVELNEAWKRDHPKQEGQSS